MIELQAFLSSFLLIAIPYVLAMISPGPDTVMIMRNSLIYSKRSGIFAALGISTSVAIHATYTLLGLGLLIKESLLIFNIIRGLGAFYLMYIGYKSFKTSAPSLDFKNTQASHDLTRFQAFKTGFLSNILNPMIIIFFVTILSSVIDFNGSFCVQCGNVSLIFLLTFLWFSFVATLLTLPPVRKQFVKLGKALGPLAGTVLIFYGLKALLLLYQSLTKG